MGEMVKIGAWQGPVVDNDFDRNCEKVLEVIDSTRNMKLDFLCFPESYLSGYSKRGIHESAIYMDDPRLTNLVANTRDLETVILVGMSERAHDGGIYNSQLVIHRGALLGTCHKTMLTEYDKEHYRTDLLLPVFEVNGVKFGVATCHTTSFVEPALYLRWRGARLLFTPHFNNIKPAGFRVKSKRVAFWEHRNMVLNNQAALATLLKMVVVRSNIVAVDDEGLAAGDCGIWDMDGNLVASGTPFVEDLVYGVFDRTIFTEEHWIDRREIPLELCEMILSAAREYRQNNQEKCHDAKTLGLMSGIVDCVREPNRSRTIGM